MSEFKFFVRTLEGNTETFGEKQNLYASSKLNAVFDVVSNKLGLEPTALRLTFLNKEVRNMPKQTLSDYKIKSNSVLVQAPYFKFFLLTIEGKNIIFSQENNLYPDTQISELYAIVSQRINIPKDEIRLVFSGKQLNQEVKATISDHKIINNSTLILTLRLRGGEQI